MFQAARKITLFLLAASVFNTGCPAGDSSATTDTSRCASGFSVTHNDDGLLISEGGSPVAQYQHAVKSKDGRWPRNNYLHPVYDLRGEIFTEDFPDDHGHHRGIFWAWHQVWIGDKRMGDAWACQDFAWNVRSVKSETHADKATLTTVTDWQSPALTDEAGNQVPFVTETAMITIHSAMQDHRVIDFSIKMQPLVDNVRIGGSEDRKGYGGFSPRIRLNADQVFLSESGEVQPQVEAIKAGAMDRCLGQIRRSHHVRPSGQSRLSAAMDSASTTQHAERSMAGS